MTSLDRRTRFLGWLMPRVPGLSIAKMSSDQLRKTQSRGMGRGALVAAMLGRRAAGVDVRDTAAGDLPLRIYRPAGKAVSPLLTVVYFHGGGWTLGDLDVADWLCSHVAAGANAVVVSVAYRLAPTHPFPAAPYDCYAALEWITAHPEEIDADTERLAVMGESAGGNLAAVVAMLVRDRGGPQITKQVLLYPNVDLTLSHPSVQSNAHEPVLHLTDMLAFREHYTPDAASRRDWRASPLLAASHAGLPPALVQVGDHDLLHDEVVAYADALRDAGVPVQLTEYPGTPHGYLNFPYLLRAAKPALAEIVEYLSA
jgi:acetyl esterase